MNIVKLNVTATEAAVLTALTALSRETCTPRLLGQVLVVGHTSALAPAYMMTNTGESLAAATDAGDIVIDWTQLHADLTCAFTALQAAGGWQHADMDGGAARNITTMNGRYYVIDFGTMVHDPGANVPALVTHTLQELARWLIAHRKSRRATLRDIPDEYIISAFDQREVKRWRDAPDDAPSAPKQRRIALAPVSRMTRFVDDAVTELSAATSDDACHATLLSLQAAGVVLNTEHSARLHEALQRAGYAAPTTRAGARFIAMRVATS